MVEAIRHPSRGKAHLLLGWDARTGAGVTCCHRDSRPLTERIPLDRTDPGDRCKRCFPTTKDGDQ